MKKEGTSYIVMSFLFMACFFVLMMAVGTTVNAESINIDQDTVWNTGEVKVIGDNSSLIIMPGIKLTINPGVIVKLGYQSTIVNNGILNVLGSADEPVYFTSLQDDSVGGDTNGNGYVYLPEAGDWQSIIIGENGNQASLFLNYAIIKYAYTGIDAYSANEFKVFHSTITNNSHAGIEIDSANSAQINNNNIYENYAPYYLCISRPGYTADLGLIYGGEAYIDATNNYWGDMTGPTTIDTEGVRGANISGKVYYEPFLTRIQEGEKKKNPVIIVPGILGSWYSADKGWELDPILHTYDNLYKALVENGGYIPDETIFKFPYEWRQDNALTAYQLKEKIEDVKNICHCNKVDIIAHSMGGLVARYYAESDYYNYDIDRIIFLGTPHKGSPEAYLRWEGEEGFQGWSGNIIKYFFTEQGKALGYETLFDYIQNGVRSIEQLLPDYSYLKDAGSVKFRVYDQENYPNNYPYNTFLKNLNSEENINKLTQRQIVIYNIIGNTGDNTINAISLGSGQSYWPLWMHGKEEEVIRASGDGTVPEVSSSFFPATKINNAEHSNLPSKAQRQVLEYLSGVAPIFDITETPEVKTALIISIHSPADFVVIAPDGKKLGKDFINNSNLNEIEYGFYSGFDSEAEFAVIVNPQDGEYKINLQGTGEGSYFLSANFVDESRDEEENFSGEIELGDLQNFNFAYSENSESPLSELEPVDIDSIPPVVTINNPIENTKYLHSDKINIQYSAIDNFSGLKDVNIILDGDLISSDSLDLFNYELGEHDLIFEAEDNAGNQASSSVAFEIIASIDSAISDIKRMRGNNWIANNIVSLALRTGLNTIKKGIDVFDQQIKRLEEKKLSILNNPKINQNMKNKQIEIIEKEIFKISQNRNIFIQKSFKLYEAEVAGFFKLSLINKQAYGIIKSNNNYLKENI